MSNSTTVDDVFSIAGKQLATLIDQRLESGHLDPNKVFEFYRAKTEAQVRWTLKEANEGGKFAEILQQVLDDMEDWDGA